jgi:hypothetical protein
LRGCLPWIILALLGLGPLVVCALLGPPEAESQLGQKAAPDWSRATSVGSEFYGSDSGAPIVVDGNKRVHFVWALRFTALEHDLRYLRLDEQGLVEEEHDLNLSLFQPRVVQLLLEGDDSLHVFLLASSERDAPSGLYHFILTEEGRLRAEPQLLSSETAPCFEYDVAMSESGLTHVFWTEGTGAERDMYYLDLPADREAVFTPRLIASGVSSPAAAMGPDDTLHLFWEGPGDDEHHAKLYYLATDHDVPESLLGPELLDLPTGRRFFRTGPVVAFDAEYAYLVWTVEYRRDMSAPAISEGWYGSFPLDSPSSISARPFSLPMDERPAYEPHDSPYRYDYLVLSRGEEEFGSERTTSPSPLVHPGEAMVTGGMTMFRGASLEHQIVNLVFGGGELVGYQVACNTTHWSRLSNLVVDGDGDLHLSWVDGLEPGPSAVYYATTARAVRERVDGLTRDDLLFAAMSMGFGAVFGASVLPLAVAWVLPALIWAFIAGRFLGRQGVVDVKGYVALLVAVVIYEASKLYFSPTLLTYVPFSASVTFLPEGAYASLRILVPVTTTGIAALGAWLALRRSEARSLLIASLVFMVIDVSLTLVVYGPGLTLL